MARISTQINRACGGKAEIKDFMRYIDVQPEDDEDSLESFAKLMQARPKGE